MASAKRLLAAQSWSVEYMGDAIDDAREVDGVWYRRDIITRKFAQIVLQHRVVPLFENPRPSATLKFP
jgi:hypothetical protein